MPPKVRRITKQTLIYVVDVVLDDIDPPIRRRVELAGDSTLEQVHYVIQAAMGWENSHLHEFEHKGLSYGDPEPDGFNLESETDNQLASLLGPGDSMTYTYDFGDNWKHTIAVHEITQPEPGVKYPRLVEAERGCPPEDIGGPWQYSDMLDEARRNPEDEELNWLLEIDSEDPQREQLEKSLARLAWKPLAG